MIGSYKKWGTEGHIEKPYENYHKKRKKSKPSHVKSKRLCAYKDSNGNCALSSYVNCGLACKRPGECHHFKALKQSEAENPVFARAPVQAKPIPHRREALFLVGTTVIHAKFGKGVVKDVSDGRITVAFSEEEKVLGLEVCYKNGLLTIEK